MADNTQLLKASKFHGYSVMPVINRPGVEVDSTVRPCGVSAVQLHIGYLPHRKGLCLYIAETNKFCAEITPLAFLKSEEQGKTLQTVLDWMILKIEPKSQ